MGATVGIAGMDWQRTIDRDWLHHAVPGGDRHPMLLDQSGIDFRIERSPSN